MNDSTDGASTPLTKQARPKRKRPTYSFSARFIPKLNMDDPTDEASTDGASTDVTWIDGASTDGASTDGVSMEGVLIDRASAPPTHKAPPSRPRLTSHENQTQGINLVTNAGPGSFLTRFTPKSNDINLVSAAGPSPFSTRFLPKSQPVTGRPAQFLPTSQPANVEGINLVSGQPTSITPFERMRADNITRNMAMMDDFADALTQNVTTSKVVGASPSPLTTQTLSKSQLANAKGFEARAKARTDETRDWNNSKQDQREQGEHYNNADVAKILALYLVCTNSYHRVIREGEQSVVAGGIDKNWLRKIPLQGKAFYGDDASWPELEKMVITRAYELFNSVPASHVASGDWGSRRAPFPTFDTSWNSLRENLFLYQDLRRDVLEVQKRCSEQFYDVVKGDPAFLVDVEKDYIPASTLQTLYHVQEAEVECRQKLTATTLESATIEAIDNLLIGHISQDVVVPAGSMFPGKCEHGVAVRWIMSTYNFSPEEASELMLSEPWALLRRRQGKQDKPKYPVHLTNYPEGSGATRTGEPTKEPLEHFDTVLTNSLDMVLKEIDRQRFSANLKAFLAINERLPELLTRRSAKKKMAQTRDEWGRMQACHMESADLLHDNLFHSQAFKNSILTRLQGWPEEQLQKIEQTWLRLIAVVAISFGCTSEPAFFLTTMDRLLDQLRYHIGFAYNIYSETAGGKVKILNQPLRSTSFTVCSKATADIMSLPGHETPYVPVRLEDHECRMIFGELARFLRGSVVAAVDTTKAFYPIPSNDPTRFIFESLLSWKPTCATCGLKIHLPEAELPRRPIAVGVKDIRVGNKSVRSSVSENRQDVYVCFSWFTSRFTGFSSASEWKFWSHTFGPFFFYFADLYHPYCKMFREKETAYA